MNLRYLRNQELLDNTERLVRKERELTTEILWHLREIGRRRLHLEQGYGSLHDYCRGKLGYSEGSAARRVSAARLLSDVPEIESAIQDGRINLTHLNLVDHFLKAEAGQSGKKYTPEEKKTLLESVECKSNRETEKLLAAISPEAMIPQERTRVITSEKSEIKLVVSEEFLEKLKRLKDILSHKLPGACMSEAIEITIDDYLRRNDPEQKDTGRQNKNDSRATSPAEPAMERILASATESPENHSPAPPAESPMDRENPGRYIAAQVDREVRARDQHQCSFINPHTGKRCGSRFQLEIDHIVPHALGGTNEPGNLRLVCRSHNQWLAVQAFGERKMRKYFNS